MLNENKSQWKITLIENDETSDEEISKPFQNFFSGIIKNLNIQRPNIFLTPPKWVQSVTRTFCETGDFWIWERTID